MSRHLKPPAPGKGKRIEARATASPVSDDECHPLFCFEHLQKGFCISDCTTDEKAAFADKLRRMSSLTWRQLREAGRHGQGYEKISRLNVPVPAHFTEEVNIIALRFFGKAPVVGIKVRRVFHVLWLDRNFTVYDHG